MHIGIPLNEFISAAMQKVRDSNDQIGAAVTRLCTALAETGMVWLRPFNNQRVVLASELNAEAIRPLLPDGEWRNLWQHFTPMQGGDVLQHWVPETVEKIVTAQSLTFPRTRLIPAIREIGPKNNQFGDYSGQGLIDRLAEIQSPDHDKRHERNLFEKVNSFLQNVTGHSEAMIEVPHNRQHVLVHMDHKVLPLTSLGTGIQEVVMIAAFCTMSENEIVCVEEPELHLHPLLQRKLVNYLRDTTSNQYFIATHSPAFIDTRDAAIFHVSLREKQTTIREALLRSERFQICVDLGHRASDLLQSNAVVWVEGPSDRIYLRHWISAASTQRLVEGIHYSIMFYGGRLLSHLTANDEEITEFIRLKSLNQNIAIVMDSDRASADDAINETKIRIRREFEAGNAIAWVTEGREIENYLDYTVLQEATRLVHPNIYGTPLAAAKFGHALYFRRSDATSATSATPSSIQEDVDKLKVAKEVCRQPANLDIYDLRVRVGEIVTMIDRANA